MKLNDEELTVVRGAVSQEISRAMTFPGGTRTVVFCHLLSAYFVLCGEFERRNPADQTIGHHASVLYEAEKKQKEEGGF